MSSYVAAPDWQVSQWFNTRGALDLATLRGKVVVLGRLDDLAAGAEIMRLVTEAPG